MLFLPSSLQTKLWFRFAFSNFGFCHSFRPFFVSSSTPSMEILLQNVDRHQWLFGIIPFRFSVLCFSHRYRHQILNEHACSCSAFHHRRERVNEPKKMANVLTYSSESSSDGGGSNNLLGTLFHLFCCCLPLSAPFLFIEANSRSHSFSIVEIKQ